MTLESLLLQEDQSQLASDVLAEGDSHRGAILFYQQRMGCSTCHSTDGNEKSLGPDLANIGSAIARQDRGQDVTAQYLVESLLQPAKVIRKSFKCVLIVTDEGVVHSGILDRETSEHVILRVASQNSQLRTIVKSQIEDRRDGISIMPKGLVNQLVSRQQFLDLTRYLVEIAAGGIQRARELQPSESLVELSPLPAYEQTVDHAGLISDLDEESFERGATLYKQLCANCHGTHDRPGSLPTSLRFASGKFKNGSDPYRMYLTLTHGFGMMVAQRWMVPQQKYDVIHYIREAYLRNHNPSQYVPVDPAYLENLPPGTTRGPQPQELTPWSIMDYGPSLNATYEICLNNSGDDVGWNLGEEADADKPNDIKVEKLDDADLQRRFAYKGIAVRVDPGSGGVALGHRWMVYDHDTMHVAGAWSGTGFIDFNSIHLNDKHAVHPRLVGEISFASSGGPGWANPQTGAFSDTRPLGRDGRPYGPLPRGWVRFRGMYHHGQKVVLSYTVGDTDVLEMPGSETTNDQGSSIFSRTLSIGRSTLNLRLKVAPLETAVAVVGGNQVRLQVVDGETIAEIAANTTPQTFKVLVSGCSQSVLESHALISPPVEPLQPFTRGGSPRWPEVVNTQASRGNDAGPFAVDDLTVPIENPWNARMRMTGLDFFADGDSAAVCSWDGDVWIVRGLTSPSGTLRWQRIASGMFQPLGLKIIRGVIYVTCRDQLVILRDLNGDGETDYYECFNNDHQVTEHFHEFAMGLQTDATGNFYYAKSARHAKKAVVPHHGTLLRVSPDGSHTDIVATGFRAANGVCVNPDGSFFVTDQEGFWTPKNRLNWVREGGFYGNMNGYHDVIDSSDKAMLRPLCWITNSLDRSPAEMLWVPDNTWGQLSGALLNLSYGTGKIFIVPHEKIGSGMQGGVCELPIPQFPTGIVRGRFHPQSGDLYVCGMFAWAGDQQQPGGFYRVRFTGRPVCVPLQIQAKPSGLTITYSGELDRTAAQDANNFTINTWSLRRTAKYGSDHYDLQTLIVESVDVSDDARTVRLSIAGIRPTRCMRIEYCLQDAHGVPVKGEIHNTIHELIP